MTLCENHQYYTRTSLHNGHFSTTATASFFSHWRKGQELSRNLIRMASWCLITAIVFRLCFQTCQPFYIYRRDIFYLNSSMIFRRGPIISEDVRRRSEQFRRCYEEFRLTRTQEHKGTLTSLLKKENSDKVDHPHRPFFLSLVLVCLNN